MSIVGRLLGTNTCLRSYSTVYLAGHRPKYCWHIHRGDGMASITCNNYGITLLDLGKWNIGAWSKIRSIRFRLSTLQVSIDLGEVAPYNPLTGAKYTGETK